MQADLIDAAHGGGVAIDDGEGRDVLDDFGDASGDGMSTDATELVDGGEAGDDGVIGDVDVAGEGPVVGKDDVVADLAIMRDVRIGKAKVVGSDTGGSVSMSAAVDGGVFAEDITVADDEGGGFAGIFEVLRFGADGGEGVEFVFAANRGVAVDDDVGVELAAVSEENVGLNHAVGADLYVCSNLGVGRNDRGGVNHAVDPRSVASSSEKSERPSTLASVSSHCRSRLSRKLARWGWGH